MLFQPYSAGWEMNKHIDQKCRGCSLLLMHTAQENSFLVLNNVKQPPQPIGLECADWLSSLSLPGWVYIYTICTISLQGVVANVLFTNKFFQTLGKL